MTPDTVRRYRSIVRGISRERTQGINVYYPRGNMALKALEYVLCTDASRGVVVVGSTILAYRRGEFAGFHPNVAIAAQVASSLR